MTDHRDKCPSIFSIWYENHASVFRKKGEFWLRNDNHETVDWILKYCPFCGRKLSEDEPHIKRNILKNGDNHNDIF